jgi:hypothetical protein
LRFDYLMDDPLHNTRGGAGTDLVEPQTFHFRRLVENYVGPTARLVIASSPSSWPEKHV